MAGYYVDTIDYITIGSTGNASDFGDLTAARSSTAGTSNATRGIVGGGDEGSAVNTIEYITIGSKGNAQDFGDLTVARSRVSSASNGGGGLS